MGEYAEDAIRRMHGHAVANHYAESQGRAPYWPRRNADKAPRRKPRNRRRKMAKVFGARYAGECAICGEGWGAGDPIWYTSSDGEDVLAHADCGKEAGGRGDVGFRPMSRAAAAEAEAERPWWNEGEERAGERSEGGEGRSRKAAAATDEEKVRLAADALERLRAARRGSGPLVTSEVEEGSDDEVLFQ